MNVPTMTMDPAKAKARLKAYRAELHHEADATYQAAADGYKALAAGLPLIDINQAIAAGGYFPNGYPQLAIARADQKSVRCHVDRGQIEFDCTRYGTYWAAGLRVFANDEYAKRQAGSKWTRVPMVPPEVKSQLRRERRSLRWSKYHILWEVERWYDRDPIEPPVDPYLLKHCGGSLYAVLAEWDLTELERSVMRQLVGR